MDRKKVISKSRLKIRGSRVEKNLEGAPYLSRNKGLLEALMCIREALAEGRLDMLGLISPRRIFHLLHQLRDLLELLNRCLVPLQRGLDHLRCLTLALCKLFQSGGVLLLLLHHLLVHGGSLLRLLRQLLQQLLTLADLLRNLRVVR